MKLLEAIKVIMEGKEIKGKNKILFGDDHKLYYRALDQTKKEAVRENQRPSILADNWWRQSWEIVEEKETLSDDYLLSFDGPFKVYPEGKVKEAIKKFIGVMILRKDINWVEEKAKEIFGERLV